MSALPSSAEAEAERDRLLGALVDAVPYHRFLGIRFERMGDEVTARLPFAEPLVGNPLLPAIHGGVTGAFLETTAIMQLAWNLLGEEIDKGGPVAEAVRAGRVPPIPRTIGITIDYLRSGRARDTYARAVVKKPGRRVINVHVEAWQDSRARPIAALRGNFLMPGG